MKKSKPVYETAHGKAESGLVGRDRSLYWRRNTFSWVVIENGELTGESRLATLPLPEVILRAVNVGHALGHVMSRYTGIDKISCKEGGIGVFAARTLTRENVYHETVILALSPFHNAVYR